MLSQSARFTADSHSGEPNKPTGKIPVILALIKMEAKIVKVLHLAREGSLGLGPAMRLADLAAIERYLGPRDRRTITRGL